MTKDFERQKQAIWARVQKDLSYRVSRKAQQEIDSQASPINEDGDLEYYEASVSGHVSLLKLVAECQHFPTPKKHKGPVPKKRYQKPFEKRFHLVEFVIGDHLSMMVLGQRKLTPAKRINWKLTCEAWNEAHPYDRMTLAVLKATYYRAITEEDLQREYFAKKEREYNALWEKLLLELLNDLDEGKIEAIPLMNRLPEGFGNYSPQSFEDFERFLSQHRDELKAHALGLAIDSLTNLEKAMLIKSLKQILKEGGQP